MRKVLSIALISAIGLSLATGANAQRWHGDGYYHHNNNAAGAAIVGGVVGFALGAALESNRQPQGYYGAPAAAYSYGPPQVVNVTAWWLNVPNGPRLQKSPDEIRGMLAQGAIWCRQPDMTVFGGAQVDCFYR